MRPPAIMAKRLQGVFFIGGGKKSRRGSEVDRAAGDENIN